MENTNYRSIPQVLPSRDLIDVFLSKLQRKTPTVIHKHYPIDKIRKFYMRKIKFCQDTLNSKLMKLIDSFPKIETVHPFFSDLINVLYDKDHYKIALGKINIARTLVDRTSRDYIKLLKYGDSLYRCKSLKRIALGRMVSIAKKLDKSLAYLEQVRQHMSRLPSIDPSARTIVLCGFPNVGKSSFLNSVTRADVEVEPYPFTTKSLYVGQTDYDYVRFQVIDTPGVLDQPLENRNTIEMQAITALAHLRAVILFFMDLSESCGYSLEDQKKLFDSLKPLFRDKPVIVGLNKIDITPLNTLTPQQQQIISSLDCQVFSLSTLTGENVMELRNSACDLALVQRKTMLKKTGKLEALKDKLYVAIPQPRDNNTRPHFVPQPLKNDVIQGSYEPKTPTQRDLFLKLDEDYVFDEKDQYFVKDDEKHDIIPEIINGKNIADFIDPDLPIKLSELEEVENQRDVAGYYRVPKWSYLDIRSHLEREHVDQERQKKMSDRSIKKTSKQQFPRTLLSRINKFKDKIGKPDTELNDAEEEEIENPDPVEIKSYSENYKEKLLKSGVAKKSLSKCLKLTRRSKVKGNREGRVGDADRHIYNLKPKHLFSGKRKLNSVQRR